MLMHRNQKGFSIVEIIIVIVAIGILGGAGWYVMKTREAKTDKSASTSESTETADSESTETTDEAAAESTEWTGLVSDKGITVTVPADLYGWKQQTCDESGTTTFLLPPEKPNVKCNSDDTGFIGISIVAIDDSQTPKDCSNAATKRTEYSTYDWFVSYACDLVTVDGKQGVKTTVVENELSMSGAGSVYNYSFRLTGTHAVTIGFVDPNATSKPANVETFHKIVNSLQFD